MRPVPVLVTAALVALMPAAASGQGMRATLADGSIPAAPVAPLAGAPPADQPQPLGIRLGGWVLLPVLTTGVGTTTNAEEAAGGNGSTFGLFAPELTLTSDWARHAARFRLAGAYEKYFDGSFATFSGSAEAGARVDIAEGWTSDLDARYAYAPQSRSDVEHPVGADNPPGIQEASASAALNGRVGERGVFTIAGGVDRKLYDDAVVSGVAVDESDRNNTAFTARLRAGYEASTALTPFVEVELSRRIYDSLTDNDGLRRSSNGVAWRGGVAVDNGPFLAGEVALGTASETFDDPALATLSALTFDGSLVWTPTELTAITLAGSTALEPSSNPASSGSVIYNGSVDVAYAWRRNVTVSGTAGVRQQNQQGTGLTATRYRAGFGATWMVNQNHHLSAEYEHAWQESTDPASTYQSDAVRLKLRLQR